MKASMQTARLLYVWMSQVSLAYVYSTNAINLCCVSVPYLLRKSNDGRSRSLAGRLLRHIAARSRTALTILSVFLLLLGNKSRLEITQNTVR